MGIFASLKQPSLLGRLQFYVILGVLAALAFSPWTLVFSLMSFGIPALVCASAFYLICYLPLLDWPYLAWRHTGNGLVAAACLLPASFLPFGVPWMINANLAQPNAHSVLRLPQHIFDPGNVLLVGEGVWSNVDSCGDICQTILWSGVTDHVMARKSVGPGEHLAQAILYTIEKSGQCQPLDFRAAAPAPRVGLCIMGRPIADPSFDTEIQVLGRIQAMSREPSYRENYREREFLTLWIYDCHDGCTERTAQASQETGARLAVPLNLHIEGGIDTGGPFGLFLERRPLTVTPLDQTVHAVFGWNIDGFAPRLGFDGDVSHGGPATPDPQAIAERKSKEILQREETEMAARMAPYKAQEKALADYREKLHAVEDQHKDCASAIIAPGPEPKYLGCAGSGAKLPDFSSVRAKLGAN
jgi:hypothetical protein